jgi:hypothetical protein
MSIPFEDLQDIASKLPNNDLDDVRVVGKEVSDMQRNQC